MKKPAPSREKSNRNMAPEQIQIRHPIESLGVVHATRGDIRAEKLQNRLAPKVPFPHKHDFYQIVWIESGRGWHQIDFEKFLVSKLQCFVVKPGQVHGWELSSDTRGFILEFTHESFSEESLWERGYQTRLRFLPNLLTFKENGEKVFEIASEMEKEFAQRENGFEVNLQSYLKILLIQLIRASQDQESLHRESFSVVEDFRQIIDENFHKHHAVEFYSHRLGLSSKALTMRISRSTGKSARQLIQERILIEAKRLLGYTNSSVKEIGYKLGFEDPNYFVRFFREQVGTTPLKFRQGLIRK